MRSVPLSLSPSPSISRVRVSRTSSLSGERFLPCPSNSGIQSEPVHGASQTVDLFPTICPEIVVRDARVEDCWEVADTHCSTFFSNYTFPLDLLLRINRFLGLVSGFSVPSGCMRTCLVAVTGPALNEKLFIAIEDFKIGGFGGKCSFNRWSVSGILTLDTVADYLPKKGPFRQRRAGVAYISNVAVRESERRKGVTKVLVAEAEAKAHSWGCRSVALHCDADNLAAVRLYEGQGFGIIKMSKQAKWPQPRTSPNVKFHFMMKLLSPSKTSSGSS